jgi:hypothetical protein
MVAAACEPASRGKGVARVGEFEPHTGCWMGWPDSGYLWRDGAKPAQAQYAAVAKAISEFEPLTMFANAGEARRDAGPCMFILLLVGDVCWAIHCSCACYGRILLRSHDVLSTSMPVIAAVACILPCIL